MLKTLINIGLTLFFAISLLFIWLYFGLLYEKIVRPTFKNLDTESFLWLGLIVLVLIVVEVLIFKRFMKAMKKK